MPAPSRSTQPGASSRRYSTPRARTTARAETVRSAAGCAHDESALAGLERDDSAGDLRSGAEEPRLLVGPLGELAAAQPTRKAEVVADQRARARLATDTARVEHGRPESLGGCVDGGAQPGRAGADDDEVGVVCLELGREAARSCELGGGRVDEDGAVGERDRRRGVSLGRFDPMRNPQSSERRLQLVRARRARVGDARLRRPGPRPSAWPTPAGAPRSSGGRPRRESAWGGRRTGRSSRATSPATRGRRARGRSSRATGSAGRAVRPGSAPGRLPAAPPRARQRPGRPPRRRRLPRPGRASSPGRRSSSPRPRSRRCSAG